MPPCLSAFLPFTVFVKSRYQEAQCLVTSAYTTYPRPRRVVYFNWPTMGNERRDSPWGEKVYYALKSTVFDSSRVVFLPLSLSLFLYVLFSFYFISSRAFLVKGEVAGGINLRTREEQQSNIVESRRTAGVTGVSAYYSHSRELSSLKLTPLLFRD